MIKTQRQEIGAAAEEVVLADADRARGMGVSVLNLGPDTVYLGGADVTAGAAGNGWPLEVGGKHDFDTAGPADKLFARCEAAGTAVIKTFQVGA